VGEGQEIESRGAGIGKQRKRNGNGNGKQNIPDSAIESIAITSGIAALCNVVENLYQEDKGQWSAIFWCR